jgi:hypothetical protein
MSYTNADGLFILTDGEQGTINITGAETDEVVVLDLDLTDLPGAGDITALNAFVPAGAYIKEAFLIMSEGATSAGSTTLDIGLAKQDGTPIDADGIDAAIAKTAIDAVGEVVRCDGALSGGTATVGADDAYVYFTVGTGPFTAGKAKLAINYVKV